MASANLFQQYLQPVKSVTEYGADMDRAEGNQLALIGQRRQNEMAGLQAEQTRGSIADAAAKRNAIQQVYASLGPQATPIARARALQSNPLTAQEGVAAEKAIADNDKTVAGTEKERAEAQAKQAQTRYEALDRHARQLPYVQTPQDVDAYADGTLELMGVPPEKRAQAKAQMVAKVQQMGLDAWKQVAAQQAVSIVDKFRVDAENARSAAANQTSRDNNRDTNATSRSNNAATVGATIRGQNITDARAKETNLLNKDAARTQIVVDPEMGVLAVDKGTGTYRAVTGAAGAIPGENKVAARKLAANLGVGIATARELIPKATSSGIGAGVDAAGNLFGHSTEGGDAASQLETLAGWMTANVPRMQGPQSDKDVMLYRQMAGAVGDRTKPASVRLKALDTLEQLQQKYAEINGAATGSPAAAPAQKGQRIRFDAQGKQLP